MLKLNTISAQPGSVHNRKRLGRGEGSGHGQQSTKGHKGQHARSGKGKVRPGFEGGQNPLYRRLPKRGFKNVLAGSVCEINVSQLERLDPAQFSEISLKTLSAANLVKGRYDRLAVLGTGNLSKAFNVKAHRVSKTALEKIEKAGGKAEILSFGKLLRKPRVKKNKSVK